MLSFSLSLNVDFLYVRTSIWKGGGIQICIFRKRLILFFRESIYRCKTSPLFFCVFIALGRIIWDSFSFLERRRDFLFQRDREFVDLHIRDQSMREESFLVHLVGIKPHDCRKYMSCLSVRRNHEELRREIEIVIVKHQ